MSALLADGGRPASAESPRRPRTYHARSRHAGADEILERPDLGPGRSWTSATSSRINRSWGTAVHRLISKPCLHAPLRHSKQNAIDTGKGTFWDLADLAFRPRGLSFSTLWT